MVRTTKAAKKQPGQRGQLRIIGGEWRGRKLQFPDAEGLRPTADRVRETLFNWLQMRIAGARCLDLFSGSGALGLEALSRGASQATMVELNRDAAQQIRQHLQTLKSDHGTVENGDALQYLSKSGGPFDIVFLDPPYQLGCLEECCKQLEQGNWLNDHAVIYLEDSSKRPEPTLPDNWQITKRKKAGEIGYYLAERQPNR